MSSFGQTPFGDVMEMLRKCAAGFKHKEYLHTHCIMFGGKTYPSLPKKPQIDNGHVKKMARHLQILDCAKATLGI